MQINSIVIVGGGSSGWMAAAALSELCPKISVTLIESKNVPIIGVGESTLGHMNRYLSMLGIKDEDWMVDCNAVYKNSIRFKNFRKNDGSYFEYPFVNHYDFTGKPRGIDTWSELSLKYPTIFTPDTFSEMFAPAQTYLAKYNRQTKNEDNSLRNFNFKYDTAYHMDAILFGKWLKEKIAIPNGVRHIFGDVVSYTKDENGNIVSMVTGDNELLHADLWIDCTGFKSQILEQWMGSEFISFEDILPTNKAWVCHFPYKDKKTEMLNVTNCTALGYGWAWQISLWNRMGTGYVFSDKFTTKEDALIEFKNYLSTIDPERAKLVEPRLIDIRHGVRKKAWVGNVVGVGLSYGFIEPLESTGLLTTHETIIRLVESLNRRDGWITRTEREIFNYSSELELFTFRDFVCMHYALSQRNDTEFWRWYTDNHELKPDIHNSKFQLKEGEKLFSDSLNPIFLGNSFDRSFRMQGANFIIAGMGLRSISTKSLMSTHYDYAKARSDDLSKFVHEEDLERVAIEFQSYRQQMSDYVKTLPTQYEFLLKTLYKTDD